MPRSQLPAPAKSRPTLRVAAARSPKAGLELAGSGSPCSAMDFKGGSGDGGCRWTSGPRKCSAMLTSFPPVRRTVDWATAKFFDRLVHGLWLDTDDVQARYDVNAIASDHLPLNEILIKDWRQIAPGSDAAVIEFNFRAAGNAKRKLLRRLQGHVSKRRGGLRLRSAMSLKWLADYALAYDIVARECGGALLSWTILPSPIPE